MPKRGPQARLAALQRRRAASVSRTLVIFSDACRAQLTLEFTTRRFPSVEFPNAALFRNLDLHEGAPISTLARRAGVSRQAMQKLARALERAGFVRLLNDPVDRRRLRVQFTTKGRSMIRASLDVYDQFDREFSTVLGARRLEQLRAALQILMRDWPPATCAAGGGRGSAAAADKRRPARRRV